MATKPISNDYNKILFSVSASGETVDATQELLTLSFSNILGSFVGAMPITGSFSRSAVNHASGVATQMGSVFTGKFLEYLR